MVRGKLFSFVSCFPHWLQSHRLEFTIPVALPWLHWEYGAKRVPLHFAFLGYAGEEERKGCCLG